MAHYRSNWAVILAVVLGVVLGVARAQEAPAFSASVAAAEPTISAPDPAPSAVPEPILMLNSSSSAIRTVPPARERRVADRQFWTFVAITGTCAVLDGESTMHGLQAPGRREMNPVLGSHPDRARFYATVGASDAAFSYLAYRLKRGGHEKLWRMPLLGASVAHFSGFVNNLQY